MGITLTSRPVRSLTGAPARSSHSCSRRASTFRSTGRLVSRFVRIRGTGSGTEEMRALDKTELQRLAAAARYRDAGLVSANRAKCPKSTARGRLPFGGGGQDGVHSADLDHQVRVGAPLYRW